MLVQTATPALTGRKASQVRQVPPVLPVLTAPMEWTARTEAMALQVSKDLLAPPARKVTKGKRVHKDPMGRQAPKGPPVPLVHLVRTAQMVPMARQVQPEMTDPMVQTVRKA